MTVAAVLRAVLRAPVAPETWRSVAYTLLSLAGDIRVSRTFRDISSVKMLLPRAVLEQLG